MTRGLSVSVRCRNGLGFRGIVGNARCALLPSRDQRFGLHGNDRDKSTCGPRRRVRVPSACREPRREQQPMTHPRPKLDTPSDERNADDGACARVEAGIDPAPANRPTESARSRETGDAVSAIMTVDELAALLRMDRKSVYAAIQRGEIPGVRRIGRALRIDRATVVAWLATGQGAPPRSRRSP